MKHFVPVGLLRDSLAFNLIHTPFQGFDFAKSPVIERYDMRQCVPNSNEVIQDPSGSM